MYNFALIIREILYKYQRTVCWSTKGKSIVACTQDEKLVTLTKDKLDLDKTFDCPTNQLTGRILFFCQLIFLFRNFFDSFFCCIKVKSIHCCGPKEFAIGYEKNDKQPVLGYTELKTEKVLIN